MLKTSSILVQTSSGLLQTTTTRDGSDHYNIYVTARTELGRKLAGSSPHRIVHPTLGTFDCLDGLWYWCLTGKTHSILRRESGIIVKQRGMKHQQTMYPEFKQDILLGIHSRLANSPELYDLLMQSNPTLPFSQYTVFGSAAKDISKPYLFVLKEYDAIRNGKPLLPESRLF